MSVLALITDPRAARQILDHLGFPTVANTSASARPPPDTAFQFDQVIDDPCIDAPSPD